MKRNRFTEEQIDFARKPAKTGMPDAVVVRWMGISEPTFYHWRRH